MDTLYVYTLATQQLLTDNLPCGMGWSLMCMHCMPHPLENLEVGKNIPCILIKIITNYMVSICFLLSINKGTTTELQVRNKLTARVKCAGGIQQGDSLTPAMFNPTMDKLIDSIMTIRGYTIQMTIQNKR